MTFSRLLPCAILCVSVVPSAIASAPDGAAIYRASCADCHGERGEGVAGVFEQPLVGDKSLVELTQIVVETMPKDEAKTIVGEDAAAVAKYVYDAFYSEVAQARNRPARVELSRLTNRRYEHAVTDLLATFTGRAWPGDERGLEARYYAERRIRGKPVVARRDNTVDLDFGESTPDPENESFKAEQFAIRWEGSIVAPRTGVYEFVVESENGTRLWVNGRDALIDAWVKSGNDTRYAATIRLLGGRAYPLRLDFFTFKERTASIRLKWRSPHGVEEIVPERNLVPRRVPETYVVTTPFPPDDASEGYVRGTSVSKAWDAATTNAAIDVADHVVRNLDRYAKSKPDDPGRREKTRAFAARFVELAFRRPLSDEERTFFVDRWFEPENDGEPIPVERAVKRIVILALKSPRFLYHRGGHTGDPFDVASELAFGLWDSLPDDALLRAARENRLQTEQQLLVHARRMSRDPRATEKLRTFLTSWLKLDHLGEIAKDDEVFPEFGEHVVADLRTSLELEIDAWLASERTDFRELLNGNEAFVNERLSAVLGLAAPEGDGFRRRKLDGPRAGLLTHPLLLAGLAYDDVTSPIHRGVFLARSVLGRRLRPPPDAFTPLPAEDHPEFTTRQRIAFQTRPAACAGCHGMINPLGFPLEQFDAIGRFRETENGKPIDAGGAYVDKTGQRVTFDGAAALARYLRDSPEVHTAFAEQLFQYAVKQPVQAYGPDRLAGLRREFAAAEFDVRDLFAKCASMAAVGVDRPRSPMKTPPR